MTDAAGLDLARVRANLSFTDAELGRMDAGDERDVELTPGVLDSVEFGLLSLLERYPDPSVEDVLESEPAAEPVAEAPTSEELELEVESAAAEAGGRTIEVELLSTPRGTEQLAHTVTPA